MQSNITLMRIGGLLKKSLAMLALICIFIGSVNAQVYINGNLSTGPVSSTGDAAPAGFNWSEVQNGNNTGGVGANIAAGLTVADDFTVPAGSWDLAKFTCYAYSTNYAGTTSPFNDIRIRIYNTNPSIGTPAPIFGDLTTNRFTASSSANLYRIFTGTAGLTRQIWKIEANIALTVTAGTYWIEWQVGTAQPSNFTPTSTVPGTTTQPGNNALQNTLPNTWTALVDGPSGAEPQDLPFRLDYTTAACTGTPTPGTTITTAASVCPQTPFTLSPQNGTAGSGVTYQWQSSTDGVTFINIPGATNNTYTTSITANTYYQVIVICSGGTPATSTPVQVTLNPPNLCYCIPTMSDCTDGDVITRVQLGTLDNSSDCGTNGFTYYGIDPTVNVPDVVQGVGNPMSITAGGGAFDETVGVWIDADHSGTFDASEFTYFGLTAGGTLTGLLNVPANSILGPARMRVRVRYNVALTGTDACTAYGFGETEDYTVNIVPCIQGVINTQPVAATITCGDNVIFTASATGTLLNYQWQYRTTPTGPWINVINGGSISGATTDTLQINNVDASFNQYEFRVLISGGCTATDFSETALLTVNQLVINVTPASYTSCAPIPAGAPIPLSITNTTGVSTLTTTNYPSGPLALAIPDLDDAVGVSNTIAVPALPAGAVITGAKVTLNVTHTYVGDLIFALKAPNGRVLNLDYALSATGGPGATTGFTNTVISSTGTQTLDAGVDPWTGVFAPDAVTTPATGNPPSSPSVIAANADANSFSDLYSVPSGNWILGVYDYASPDSGTLNDWTLTLTYSVPSTVAVTGVWSPATGLFSDAAGLVPYVAGTQATTVYAAPNTTTSYTVTVTNTSCPSNPVQIPVNIISPDPGNTISTASSVCGGSPVTLSVENPLIGDLSYQWQSSNDGVTFTDIAGATDSIYTATITGATYFQLVVTCSGGSVATSNPVFVGFLSADPVITISATPYTALAPGLVTTVTATVSPAASSNATYQWFSNGVSIPGATGNTFQAGVDQIGELSVELTDSTFCSGRVSASITLTDSLTTRLFVYPNPNNGVFQVRFNNGVNDILNGSRILTVYDSKGARVYSKTYNINSIYARMDVDLSRQPKGVYVIDLIDQSGNRLQSERVIVH